jgi:hypothetical protein
LRFNDVNLAELLRDDLLAQGTVAEVGGGSHEWAPSEDFERPWLVQDAQGETVEVLEFDGTYTVVESNYFGYLGDLPDVMYLNNVLERSEQALIPAETLTLDYSKRFAKFTKAQDLPAEPLISGTVVLLPDPSAAKLLFTGLQRIGD